MIESMMISWWKRKNTTKSAQQCSRTSDWMLLYAFHCKAPRFFFSASKQPDLWLWLPRRILYCQVYAVGGARMSKGFLALVSQVVLAPGFWLLPCLWVSLLASGRIPVFWCFWRLCISTGRCFFFPYLRRTCLTQAANIPSRKHTYIFIPYCMYIYILYVYI